MIVIAIIIGLAISVLYSFILVRFAKKAIAKGKKVSWPIWTYLWGVLITAPCGLIAGSIPGALEFFQPNLDSIIVFESIGIAIGLPFFAMHLFGGIVLPIIWFGLLIIAILNKISKSTSS